MPQESQNDFVLQSNANPQGSTDVHIEASQNGCLIKISTLACTPIPEIYSFISAQKGVHVEVVYVDV